MIILLLQQIVLTSGHPGSKANPVAQASASPCTAWNAGRGRSREGQRWTTAQSAACLPALVMLSRISLICLLVCNPVGSTGAICMTVGPKFAQLFHWNLNPVFWQSQSRHNVWRAKEDRSQLSHHNRRRTWPGQTRAQRCQNRGPEEIFSTPCYFFEVSCLQLYETNWSSETIHGFQKLMSFSKLPSFWINPVWAGRHPHRRPANRGSPRNVAGGRFFYGRTSMSDFSFFQIPRSAFIAEAEESHSNISRR